MFLEKRKFDKFIDVFSSFDFMIRIIIHLMLRNMFSYRLFECKVQEFFMKSNYCVLYKLIRRRSDFIFHILK